MDSPTLGQRVRAARKHRHLSQVKLAEKAHLSEATIKHLEAGRHTPSHGTLVALADALDIPVAQLLVVSAEALAGLLRHMPLDDVVEALALAHIDVQALVAAMGRQPLYLMPETRYA